MIMMVLMVGNLVKMIKILFSEMRMTHLISQMLPVTKMTIQNNTQILTAVLKIS